MDTTIRTTGAHTYFRAIETGLLLRAGMSEEEVAKDYGANVVSVGKLYEHMSFEEIVHHLTGQHGEAGIKAAFSTMSLPGILSNVAGKRLLKGYQSQPVAAMKLCSIGDLNDFKPSERYGLTDVGDLEQVGPDGEIKHGSLAERKAVNQLKTYAKLIVLTREALLNDDLQAFLRLPEMMGARAARKIDQVFFSRLLSNPGGLFSAAHKNLLTGADSALSPTSLASAIQTFLEQTDEDGQPINLQPKYLLVSPALKMAAREILNSVTFISVGSANKQRIPTYNALADENLEIVTSPWLSNPNLRGASATQWYLMGDPTVSDVFELGFLRGNREPSISQGAISPDHLGMSFRVVHDFGIRELDHRAMVKSNGK